MEFLLLQDVQGLRRSSVHCTYCLPNRRSASLCTLFAKLHFTGSSPTVTYVKAALFSDPSFPALKTTLKSPY